MFYSTLEDMSFDMGLYNTQIISHSSNTILT